MRQIEHAARVLEWHGTVVTDAEVLGTRAAAVVRVREDVHRWRVRHGWKPQSDPTWFRTWFESSPLDQVPVAGVDLIGILVTASKERRALRRCGTLMTLAPCAVVLPEGHPYQPFPMTELDYYGIGVLTASSEDAPRLVLPPEDRSAEFGSSLFERWLLEVLYTRLLEHDRERSRAHR